MNLSNKDIIVFILLIISLYMNYCNMKEPFTVNLKKDAEGNFVIPGNLNVNGKIAGNEVVGYNKVEYFNPKSNRSIRLENNNEINCYHNNKLTTLHLGYKAPVHLGYTGQDVFINKVKVDSKTVGGLGNTDMEAIRNLSELANNLTKNGKLR